MKYLALLIALLLFRIWGGGERLQSDDWFARWRSRVAQWGLPEPLQLVLVLLVPVAVAAALLDAAEDVLFGLAWIALASALLLYALGRGNLAVLQARYRQQCAAGDFQAALHGTLPVLGGRIGDNPQSPQEVHSLILRAFYYYAYQRWFAVLFWFLLGGPAGALAYRLLQLHAVGQSASLAGRALALADWLPARLLAATFALAGDFVRSRDALVNAWQSPGQGADELLLNTGCAASTPEAASSGVFPVSAVAEHDECVALLSRSASVWVAGVAVLVLLA